MTENNGNKWTAGNISFLMFGIFAVMMFGLMIAGAVTSCEALKTEPCPNPAGSTAGWIGAMVFIGLGLPLLFATFIASIYAIVQNKGRTFGWIALSGAIVFVVFAVVVG